MVDTFSRRIPAGIILAFMVLLSLSVIAQEEKMDVALGPPQNKLTILA